MLRHLVTFWCMLIASSITFTQITPKERLSHTLISWCDGLDGVAKCGAFSPECGASKECAASGPLATPTGNLRRSLAYIKIPKVGGSSWGSVLRRIGSRHGMSHTRDGGDWIETQLADEEGASVWSNHGERKSIQNRVNTVMGRPFYITLLRNPVPRCMSNFYYRSALRLTVNITLRLTANMTNEITDENKVDYIQNMCNSDYLVNYTEPHGNSTVQEVFNSYDFVGITERFDESLVLLGRRLNISLVDMLYLRAKDSSEPPLSWKNITNRTVEHIPIEEESPLVQQAAEHLNHGLDSEFIKVSNDSLDKAALEYGPNLAKDVAHFSFMLKTVEYYCKDHFSEACLWEDNGCGQACIDTVARAQGWE